MKKTRYLLLAIMLIAFGVLFYLSYSYAGKRYDFIKSYYSELPQEEKNVPEHVKDVVEKLERENVKNYAVSQLGYEYAEPGKAIDWQIRNLLMGYAIESVLDEDQILALYCHFLPYEEGRGMTHSVKYYFKKDLKDATLEEVIALLVIGRSPNSYSPSKKPERFSEMKTKLLAKYNDQ